MVVQVVVLMALYVFEYAQSCQHFVMLRSQLCALQSHQPGEQLHTHTHTVGGEVLQCENCNQDWVRCVDIKGRSASRHALWSKAHFLRCALRPSCTSSKPNTENSAETNMHNSTVLTLSVTELTSLTCTRFPAWR